MSRRLDLGIALKRARDGCSHPFTRGSGTLIATVPCLASLSFEIQLKIEKTPRGHNKNGCVLAERKKVMIARDHETGAPVHRALQHAIVVGIVGNDGKRAARLNQLAHFPDFGQNLAQSGG